MGCAEQQVAETITTKETSKISSVQPKTALNGNALLISAQLTNQLKISSDSQELLKLACYPSQIVCDIGEFIIGKAVDKGLMQIKVEFEESIKDLDTQMYLMHHIINAYVRRQTQGRVFGICDFQTKGTNALFLYISKNVGYYIGDQKVEVGVKIAQIVAEAFKKSQQLIEIIFDPLYVGPELVQQLLTSMTRINETLTTLLPEIRVGTIRKVNPFPQFSFVIQLFDLSKIQKILDATYELPLANGVMTYEKDEVQPFLKQLTMPLLVLDDKLICLFLAFLSQYIQGAVVIKIPKEIEFKESYLTVISQLLTASLPQFKHLVLQPRRRDDRWVTEVELIQAKEDHLKKADYYYHYIVQLLGMELKPTIDSIYCRNDQDKQNLSQSIKQTKIALTDV